MALVAVYPTNVALIEKANASVDMGRCKGELKCMFTSVCMCPLYTCKDACKYLPIYISQSLYLHAALSERDSSNCSGYIMHVRVYVYV